MKHGLFVLTVAAVLSLSACKQNSDAAVTDAGATVATEEATATAAAAATAPAGEATAEPTVAEPTEEERERAEQQAKLDYATMEDGYLNDAEGQWATSAKASSAFGDANDPATKPTSSNTPWQATGPANGDAWTNNHQDIGFDWLELGYDKPVTATEVRVVFQSGEGAQAINKIELIDTDGKVHVVWSGLSDTKDDKRGSRTWVVRKFGATPYQAKGVKITLANNVENGYKKIDAVQLVGTGAASK